MDLSIKREGWKKEREEERRKGRCRNAKTPHPFLERRVVREGRTKEATEGYIQVEHLGGKGVNWRWSK
jgi:hypothetical protein